jgi:hypothetical protein
MAEQFDKNGGGEWVSTPTEGDFEVVLASSEIRAGDNLSIAKGAGCSLLLSDLSSY